MAAYRMYLGVSKSRGTPKSSILIGFSIINHPFQGTPILGNPHLGLSGQILLSNHEVDPKDIIFGCLQHKYMNVSRLLRRIPSRNHLFR